MSHDERYFEDELVRLFDPDRTYRKFGGFGEDAFVEELREYYEKLSLEERNPFEQAVLHWLWSGDALRRMQAISLCGDLKLGACVRPLLRLGESLRRESPAHKDLNWIVQALGHIGDPRALDFLTQEAEQGEYRNGAIVAISIMELALAMQLMAREIEHRYRQGLSPKLTEMLLWSLLSRHPASIARQMGLALRRFPDKAYLLERLSRALRSLGYDGEGKRLTKRDKLRIRADFCSGLEEPSDHLE